MTFLEVVSCIILLLCAGVIGFLGAYYIYDIYKTQNEVYEKIYGAYKNINESYTIMNKHYREILDSWKEIGECYSVTCDQFEEIEKALADIYSKVSDEEVSVRIDVPSITEAISKTNNESEDDK